MEHLPKENSGNVEQRIDCFLHLKSGKTLTYPSVRLSPLLRLLKGSKKEELKGSYWGVKRGVIGMIPCQ
jgi:hypothetical protein